jgi:hypothetical protein
MEKLLSLIAKIPCDKTTHALIGLIIYSFLTLFTSPIIAFVVVTIIGALKEVYDYIYRDIHTPDFWDFVATIAIPAILTFITITKDSL